MLNLTGKRILITGGTGSLGKTLVRRLLSGKIGLPEKVIVFSRDEAKQHQMRVEYMQKTAPTDEIIYNNFAERVVFVIGDIRDPESIAQAMRGVDIVFNAAALKQVPTCEYFPYEAVRTNISGAENIANAIIRHQLPIEAVIGISTDKAVKPVNVMGMTKSIQERIFTRANLEAENTRFVLVRYGNVLASRGSVVPLFHEQIKHGGPVTITDERMTRFLLSLEAAVDINLEALEKGHKGETFIPRVPSALIADVAKALIGHRDIEVKVTGIRPGEKLHESLVSEEEGDRTITRGDYYVIAPMLPELQREEVMRGPFLDKEYISSDDVMALDDLRGLLTRRGLMVEQVIEYEGEILR